MTTQYLVYHRTTPTFRDLDAAARAAFPQGFTLVAAVNADAPGHVFQLTNHIDHDWTTNAEVAIPAEITGGLRSTSVGDVVVDLTTGLRYAVDGMGFTEFRS